MKRYFLLILISLFFAGLVFAQRPSFEIYPEGGHPEPDITNININQLSNDLVVITATVTDFSGVSSVWIIINDAGANEIEIRALYDDGAHEDGVWGDSIYGVLVLIDPSLYPLGTFTVDIFATDILDNKAELFNVGSFLIAAGCEESEDISLCARLITNTPDLEDCVTSQGLCLKTTIPSPDTPDLEDCVTSQGLCLKTTIPSPDTPDLDDCTTSQELCLKTTIPSPNTPDLDDCVTSQGLCLKTTIPSPDTPDLDCVSSQGLCLEITSEQGGAATQINPFTASLPEVDAGSPVDLSATLKDESESPLIGKTIVFTDATDSVDIGQAVTNSSGIASISYNTSSGASVGDHTLEANYAGGPGFFPSDNTTIINITAPLCAGFLNNGYCWYAGEPGQSCDDVCADKGGTASSDCMEVDTDCLAIKNLFGTTCAGGCDSYCPAVYFYFYGVEECYSCASQDWSDNCWWGYYYGGIYARRVCVCGS